MSLKLLMSDRARDIATIYHRPYAYRIFGAVYCDGAAHRPAVRKPPFVHEAVFLNAALFFRKDFGKCYKLLPIHGNAIVKDVILSVSFSYRALR